MLVAFAWHTWVPIAVSVVALGFALRADRRASDAERRAKDAERRDVRAEMRDEIRFERERERTEAADRAVLVIEAAGAGRGTENDNFGFTIRNHGPAPASNVDIWLVDERGNDVTLKHANTFALAPTDPPRTDYGIVMPLGAEPEKLRYALKWSDRGGGDNVVTDVHPSY